MGVRIAAIVLSHNRLADTQACIAALRSQERHPDQIIVVDNASTDGSAEWLDTQTDVHTIHQANLGPSGGMRTGLKFGLANGFDWMWLMDDDILPSPAALRALCRAMEVRPDARVFNSVGMSRTNPARFALGALWVRTNPDRYAGGHRAETLAEAQRFADADGMVDSIGGHFYHGLLLHRTLVESVGMPLSWIHMGGEEVEYGLRMMRAGYHLYMVLDSIVLHPEIAHVSLRVLGKTKVFNVRPPDRRYLYLRHSVWIHRTYFPADPLSLYAARRLGGAFLAELFVIPDRTWRERLEACAASVRGIRDGFRLRPARDAAGNEMLK